MPNPITSAQVPATASAPSTHRDELTQYADRRRRGIRILASVCLALFATDLVSYAAFFAKRSGALRDHAATMCRHVVVPLPLGR